MAKHRVRRPVVLLPAKGVINQLLVLNAWRSKVPLQLVFIVIVVAEVVKGVVSSLLALWRRALRYIVSL